MEDKVERTPLVTILNQLHQKGYRKNSKISDDGCLCCTDGEEAFGPDQVRIVDFYRFEGESNTGDEAILYMLETASGLKGTVADAYGIYPDESIGRFMKQVEDIGENLDK